MISGTTHVGIDTPQHPGIYAAEVYFGWKILQWHAGEWWHTDLIGRWTASIPVQWVGPLPEPMLIRGKKGQKPELKEGKPEYDL